jgi:hypothetical protein
MTPIEELFRSPTRNVKSLNASRLLLGRKIAIFLTALTNTLKTTSSMTARRRRRLRTRVKFRHAVSIMQRRRDYGRY